MMTCKSKTLHRLDNLDRSTDERFKRVSDYTETHKIASQKGFTLGE
ncbi:hypothetical protein [Olegusella massiliensis]|nr:hypothetical protein [Olegusella massiliensis]ERL11733.1 hypothetical protein HMPREF1248_0503 [Coriobacteriaceae bacterium BV3Ac1]